MNLVSLLSGTSPRRYTGLSPRSRAAAARVALLVACVVTFTPAAVGTQPFGSVDIPVIGLAVDIDTRADIDGFQYSLTAVKDLPSVVRTFVGQPGLWTDASLPAGSRVVAELIGPGINGVRDLSAMANGPMQLGRLAAAGSYTLTRVRVVDALGATIIARDPRLGPVVIDVIDELLVTQVTSRPLTVEEIEERGIIVDSDDFTAMSFTVGMTIGSEEVEIELPVLVPSPNSDVSEAPPVPSVSLWGSSASGFESLGIPNLSLSGFTMAPPPAEDELAGIELAPVTGLVVIPGDIGFLDQFFSVLVLTTNSAPNGSGLVVHHARAEILLPPGADGVEGSGDDPLDLEPPSTRTQALLDDAGSDAIVPEATHETEFFVKGRREGTFELHLNIAGDLEVPALGTLVPISGRATGVVQVRNPTFSIILAHPQTVREFEAYTLFATVTNTSMTPANYFQLAVDERSLIGGHLAPGETATRSLEVLLPGESETFEFQMVAATTGEVTGTIFLAEPGVNGSFVLTAGVGDTGIPLSPDTLVLPQTVAYLPQAPDITSAAVRLLGQAYSIATAPLGKLPPDIPRVSKGFVFDRGIRLAQAGLHAHLGQTDLQTAVDLLADYTGSDVARLAEIFGTDPSTARSLAAEDLSAFDDVRRRSAAGRAFSEAIGELLGQSLPAQALSDLQLASAGSLASNSAHVSFAVESGNTPVFLRLSDGDGQAIGRLASSEELARDLPHAAHLPLRPAADGFAEVLFAAAAAAELYDFELVAPAAATIDISLVLPHGSGTAQVTYPSIHVPAGAFAHMRWEAGTSGPYTFALDTDGDGSAETLVEPAAVTAIVDPAPSITGVQCWGKGNRPQTPPTFASGDPLGRLVAVLFSEEVTSASAGDVTHYAVEAHAVTSAWLLPGDRLAMLTLDKPVGPFVPRTVTVSGVADRRGNATAEEISTIAADPERGVAGVVQGVVREPDGTPIPFASVDYIQPVFCPPCDFGLGSYDNRIISTHVADRQGHYEIEYVLQNSLAAGPDRWLGVQASCNTNHFKLEAMDPQTNNRATASTVIHVDGQRLNLDLIVRGRGSIYGDVFAAGGSLVTGGPPDSAASLPIVAKNISTGGTSMSWVDANGYYAFPRSHASGAGAITTAPAVPVGNVVLQVADPQRGSIAMATATIPHHGAVVEQSLTMVSVTEYGKIAGRVVEADGQTGAANVPVEISASGIGRGPLDAVITDNSGRFAFQDVPAGEVTLHAYRMSTYEEAFATIFLDGNQAGTVALLFPGFGATVRGHVYDAAGDGVAGATVAVGPTLTHTDEFGSFEIHGLPVRSFTVYAQGPDSQAVTREPVTIVSGTDDIYVALWLEPTATVLGQVRRAGGTPVAGQLVQLWTEPGRRVIAQVAADENGSFELAGYPLGNYTVRAVAADYGDGGMTATTLSYPGEHKVADIVFRGLGSISGQVVQTNGTPVLTDIIITRKVWRIISDRSAEEQQTIDNVRGLIGQNAIQDAAASAFLSAYVLPMTDFYMVRSEQLAIRSDILGPGGEVTGEFYFAGPVTAGPFTLQAVGSFFSPATEHGEMPLGGGHVQAGPIVLEPAVGSVIGTVWMPDGQTPAGAGVRVTLLSSSLPPMDVFTGANGQFDFALVPSGSFGIIADTLAPDVPAHSSAGARTDVFADLNVRLYGRGAGAVPGGETTILDVRLRDAAGVHVLVVDQAGRPVANAQVSLHTAATLDADEEEALLTQKSASTTGALELFPVIEGALSVSAVHPMTGAMGQAAGSIPVDPEPGFVLPVTVTLGAATTAEGDIVDAPAFGTVEGTIFAADGTPLANPAQVAVRAAGLRLLTTSDAQGSYRVTHVPGGSLVVEALEPFTGRRGDASGRIASQGEVVSVPVTLVGLGTVTGTVLDHDGSPPPHAARVTLYPSGSFSSAMVATTAVDGAFYLPGVPLGDYVVSAETLSALPLTGEAAGTIQAEGDLVTTDIYLEPHGTLTGTVLAAGSGAPVASANVYIHNQRVARQTQTNGSGVFSAHLPVGSYGILVRVPGTHDGAQTTAELVEHDQVLDVSITLNGTGTVRGQVLTASGNVVAGAEVVLTSHSVVSSVEPPVTTLADGSFLFDGVAIGDFDVAASKTSGGTTLRASAVGTLDAHQAVICWEDAPDPSCTASGASLRLQDAAAILGVVYESDTVTPAAGAVVAVTSATLALTRRAGADGTFSVPGLPLDTYDVSFYHPATSGVADRLGVVVATNDVDVDLGDVVLDSEPPEVVTTTPVAFASEVPPGDPISITFSESIDATTLVTGSGELANVKLTIAGQAIPFSNVLSDTGGLTGNLLTLTPSQPLPDRTRVEVLLRADILDLTGALQGPGVRDLAGLSLVTDVRFDFVTTDGTGPALLSLYPPDGAVEVGLETVIRAAFNEPIDPASVTDFSLSGGATGTWVPAQDDTVLLLMPDSLLAPDATYTATLVGVTDVAGNAYAGGTITTTFATVDTQAPAVLSLAVATGDLVLYGNTVTIEASVGDVADTAAVHLRAGASQVATSTTPAAGARYDFPLFLDPSLASPIELSAVAQDAYGNQSGPALLSLHPGPNTAPAVTLTLTPSGTVNAGQTVTVDIVATHDVGVAEVAYSAAGGALGAATEAIDPHSTNVARQFSFLVLADMQAGSQIPVRATATDILGASTTTTSTLTVVDTLGPSVAILVPADGTLVTPGESFTVLVDSADPSGVELIELRTEGVITPPQDSGPIVPPDTTVAHSFSVTMPGGTTPGAIMTVIATATDATLNPGNSTSTQIQVIAADNVRPTAIIASPADGAVNLPTDTGVEASFDEPIDPTTVTAATFIVSTGGQPAAGRFVVTQDGMVARWLPRRALEPGATYAVELTGGITDLAGNALLPPAPTTFSTDASSVIDTDLDGLTDVTELAIGTDPTMWDDFPNMDLVLHNAGVVEVGEPLVLKSLSLTNGTVLAHLAATTLDTHRLELVVGSLVIDASSRIDVTGRGYLGGEWEPGTYHPGQTLGHEPGAGGYTGQGVAGGSYGGAGGSRADGTGVTAVYGDYRNPNEHGSGGGAIGSCVWPCKNGGGLVRLTASAPAGITLDGAIIADGGDGLPTGTYSGGGGGSGGGIFIETTVLSGTGAISANGGAGGLGDYYHYFHGAGGGGRIALYYADISGFSIASVSAAGGAGSEPLNTGGAGTIFLKSTTQTHGDLIIDNGGNVARSGSTELRAIGPGSGATVVEDTSRSLWKLVDTARTFPLPNSPPGALGLIDLHLKPDTAGPATFAVLDNTAIELFVSGSMASVVAGQPYIGVYTFNDLSVLGGAQVITTDQTDVLGTLDVAAGSSLQSANLNP